MNQQEQRRRISMMQAALPHTSGVGRHYLEMLLQADQLAQTIQTSPDADLAACDIDPAAADPEQMLQSIRPFCTPAETEFLHTTWNFLKAGKLFSNYQSYRHVHPTSSQNSLMDFLLMQLTPEQRKLMDQLRTIQQVQQAEQFAGGAGNS